MKNQSYFYDCNKMNIEIYRCKYPDYGKDAHFAIIDNLYIITCDSLSSLVDAVITTMEDQALAWWADELSTSEICKLREIPIEYNFNGLDYIKDFRNANPEIFI